MPKTLYEVFTGEKNPTQTWVSRMTVEQMYKRLDDLSLCLRGKLRSGLKPILKRQKQEILDELKKVGSKDLIRGKLNEK